MLTFMCWLEKIADVLTISKAKAKNVLICKYGQPEYLPDGNIFYYQSNAPEEYMWEQETIHAMPVRYDGKLTVYKIYRGVIPMTRKKCRF